MSAPYRPFGLDAQQERKVENKLDSRQHGSSHKKKVENSPPRLVEFPRSGGSMGWGGLARSTWCVWRGARPSSRTGCFAPRSHELRGLDGLLRWLDRYLRRFVEAFGDAGVRQNFSQEWLVITDYSGIGFPEFSLRCLEVLG